MSDGGLLVQYTLKKKNHNFPVYCAVIIGWLCDLMQNLYFAPSLTDVNENGHHGYSMCCYGRAPEDKVRYTYKVKVFQHQHRHMYESMVTTMKSAYSLLWWRVLYQWYGCCVVLWFRFCRFCTYCILCYSQRLNFCLVSSISTLGESLKYWNIQVCEMR